MSAHQRLRGDGAGFAVLLVLLWWAPVPLGSNRPWSAALLSVAILVTLGALLLANLSRGETVQQRLKSARPVLLALAVWVALGGVQIVPLPHALVGWLSPASLAHWQSVSAPGLITLSVDPGTTAVSTVHSLALIGLLTLVLMLAHSWRRLMLLVFAIVAAGALQALAGIVLSLALEQGWFARGIEEGVGGVTGTFVNPNHFAGFIEMALLLSVGLSLAQPGWRVGVASLGAMALSALDAVMSRRALLIAAQLLMLVAILWSASRGAVLAVAIALVLGVAVSSLARRRLMGVSSLMLLVGVALLALVLFGPGALKDKLQTQGLSSDRNAIFYSSWRAGLDYPLLGSGAGTFRHVFPAYKQGTPDMRYYEHAHNDYLEEFVERGMLGVLAAGAAVVMVLVRIVISLRIRHDRRARALLIGSLIALIALLVHGLYDFNLRIPSNACYFVVLLGIALKAAVLPSDNLTSHRSRVR